MSDLDTLRPEVAEAIRLFGAVIEELWLHDDYESALHVLCAELLRLAAIEADALIALDCEHDWQVEHERAERAEAELAAARETIKRLNRRVQVAEAGIAEKVKASAPGSLGRALANAAADKYMRERDMAQAELAALKARIAEAPISTCGDVHAETMGGCDYCMLQAPPQLSGKRVRLLVDEPQDDNAKEGRSRE